jgi:hypothetical protein
MAPTALSRPAKPHDQQGAYVVARYWKGKKNDGMTEKAR